MDAFLDSISEDDIPSFRFYYDKCIYDINSDLELRGSTFEKCNQIEAQFRKPLFIAAFCGSQQIVAFLVKINAKLTFSDYGGNCVLHALILGAQTNPKMQKTYVEILNIIICNFSESEVASILNIRNDLGYTSLELAMKRKTYLIFLRLLELRIFKSEPHFYTFLRNEYRFDEYASKSYVFDNPLMNLPFTSLDRDLSHLEIVYSNRIFAEFISTIISNRYVQCLTVLSSCYKFLLLLITLLPWDVTLSKITFHTFIAIFTFETFVNLAFYKTLWNSKRVKSNVVLLWLWEDMWMYSYLISQISVFHSSDYEMNLKQLTYTFTYFSAIYCALHRLQLIPYFGCLLYTSPSPRD